MVKRRTLRTRSAEPVPEEAAAATAEPAEEVAADLPDMDDEPEEDGFRRARSADKPEFKHFLPLPKPAHLIYIKPTVAVVADVASRSSVGLKMTAGNVQLERYVVEYYARSVK